MQSLYLNRQPRKENTTYEIDITRLILWKYEPCENGATKINGKNCVLEVVDIVETTAENRQHWLDRFNEEATKSGFFHAHIDEEYVPTKKQPNDPVAVLIPVIPDPKWNPTADTLAYPTEACVNEQDYDDTRWAVAEITGDSITYSGGYEDVTLTIKGAKPHVLAKALHAALTIVFE